MTGFVPQPAPDGALLFQYGTWSYESIEPVSGRRRRPTATGGSISPGLIIGAVVAGVGLFLIGYWTRAATAVRLRRGVGGPCR